jgi:wyosine [tRNA(Phe)-imidazoG37] synthetase (radical SAM superfamily)
LHLPEVRKEAALADKVKVTLSAWDVESFRQLHNPARGITFKQLIDGERLFRSAYTGELSVEVFIVKGVNSDVVNAGKIAELVQSLNPDRVDLNTAVRPPAKSGVQACSEDRMNELARLFGEKASVTASFKRKETAATEVTDEMLLGLIKRHPATALQLGEQFGVSVEKVLLMLQEMAEDGALRTEVRDGDVYYFCRDV